MIFLFLFIEIFFTSTFCSFRCTGGPNCHITLNFNQIIPSHQELPRTCSIIDAPSCTIYLKIDYNNKQVNILFNEVPMDIKSLYSMMDPLAANLNTSIILRYAVKVRIRKIELYVLIQCRTIDRCADRQLRHFWPRFISLNPRRNIYMPFYKLLFSNTSNVHSCFNDQTNQIEQCLHTNNICWASSNTHRSCAEYDNEESNGFIYSYNKVDLPHRLTTENVNYVLTCRVNNCNNNETINRVRSRRIFFERKISIKILFIAQ
jgi:hypothetical protein